MITLDVTLPLAGFRMRIATTLHARATVIMGPSGAGKTSLLEAIAGLRPRTRGRIRIGEETLLDTARGLVRRPEGRGVGYVPQDACLFPHLTVLGNVRFGARGDEARVAAALSALELDRLRDRVPASLSGGERQRVALGRALASHPRVLLLDEPLAALDTALRGRILPYLLRVRDEWNVPIVYVTHHLGEAVALGSELLLLRNGTIEAQGPAVELLSAAGSIGPAPDGLDNLLCSTVRSHDRTGGITHVQLAGGIDLAIPLATEHVPGAAVTVAVRAEDVLVATEEPRHVSARNRFPARVLAVHRSDVDVLVRCGPVAGGAAWLVRLTPGAVDALDLTPDRMVWLAVKSHSVRTLA